MAETSVEIEWVPCDAGNPAHAIVGPFIAHNWRDHICLQLLEGDGSLEEALSLQKQIKQLGFEAQYDGHIPCSLSREATRQSSSTQDSISIMVAKNGMSISRCATVRDVAMLGKLVEIAREGNPL